MIGMWMDVSTGNDENEKDVKNDEEVKEEIADSIIRDKEEETTTSVLTEKRKLSKSQSTLISLFKVLVDPKFMEGEEIYDFNDEINKIDLHIDILEAIKFFKLLLDENGNIRQGISNEQLESAKFKLLKALKYAIMANDIQAVMNLLEILNRPKDVPSLYPQLYPFVTPYPIKGW
jgi:hypothetical protein